MVDNVAEKHLADNTELESESGIEYEGSDDGGYLPLRLRRRYNKAKAIFEAGVWACESMDLLLGIMLGSMPDVNNSYVLLRQDNRDLRKELAKMGLVYEDCLCGELSPDSHQFIKRDGTCGMTIGNLWHLHGFFRFKEFIHAADLHGLLSPLWGKIHGSSVVDVKILYDVDKVIKYNVKEAVKGHCRDGSQGRRLLMSDGWLPAGYRKVDWLLTQWALFHGGNWASGDDLSLRRQEGEYIAMAWDIRREFLRDWCGGALITLDYGDYDMYIIGDKVYRGGSGR